MNNCCPRNVKYLDGTMQRILFKKFGKNRGCGLSPLAYVFTGVEAGRALSRDVWNEMGGEVGHYKYDDNRYKYAK